MLFNSFEFLLFLAIVFSIYWIARYLGYKTQNWILFICSYVFYGWWDWRFLLLILLSSLVDYFIAIKIDHSTSQKARKLFLYVSFAANLGVLFFFKYFGFFITSASDLLINLGFSPNIHSLQFILPVGISFYTFQTMSYTIDVYRREIVPTRDLIAFLSFVSFFPQLVAGPIERARRLLPQFLQSRSFDYTQAMDGLRLILWGFFKKVVVADNCSLYVDHIFANYNHASSTELLSGLVFFSFQIYGDFSGYSDIARGVSKLFGFELMINFRTPYFARDIAEFWRRWHISLTSWFKDYVYIPLGGSQLGMTKALRNTFIVFLISGLWHGANWTFVVWGLLNALYFIPLLLSRRNRHHLDEITLSSFYSSFKVFVSILMTFFLVSFTWLFFRSPSISFSLDYLNNIFYPSSGISFNVIGVDLLLLVCLTLIIGDWYFRKDDIPFKRIKQKVYRYTSYSLVVLFIVFFGSYINPQSFIYFQF